MKKWLFFLIPALTLVLLYPRILRSARTLSVVLFKFGMLVTAIRPWIRNTYPGVGLLPQTITTALSVWYALQLIWDVKNPSESKLPLKRLSVSL